MDLKKHALEAATLVVLAVLCAGVSNTLADRERRLKLVGDYKPNQGPPPERPAPPPELAEAAVQPAVATPAEAAPPAPATVAPVAATPGTLGTPAPTVPKPAASPAPSQAPKPASKEELLARFPVHPDKPYVEVTGKDTAWLYAQGVLFLDARRTKVFEEGHIAGAQPMSVWESDVDQKTVALLNEGRDQELPIVIYCSGGDCEDSHMLSEKLFGAGFNNLLVYRDGWPDWVKRGGAQAKGPAR